MCKFKAVDRLVVITNNAKLCCTAEKIDNGLLRPVQVLVFVHENVIVKALFGCRRIVVKILVKLRHDLPRAVQRSSLRWYCDD
jgi:hypothetical protein